MILSDKNLKKLITEALVIEAEDAQEAGAMGFMARVLVQATIPHKKTSDVVFSRRNGDFNLSISSLPGIGLPYGSIPRLLLAWLTTEAVKTKERELILGESMSDFMRQLGLVPTGGRWGSITRLKDQTKRLFMANVQCYVDNKEQFSGKNFRVAEGYNLWWKSQSLDQKTPWQSSVLLDQAFFEEIIDRPVPIDMRALKVLKQSPLALDVYIWLTYRMSYLKHQTEIPWGALQMQFGADYPHTQRGKRNFKIKFLQQMQKVLTVYPEAKINTGTVGLVLLPSKTHINSQLKKPC